LIDDDSFAVKWKPDNPPAPVFPEIISPFHADPSPIMIGIIAGWNYIVMKWVFQHEIEYDSTN
jgi:hypothetical protein